MEHERYWHPNKLGFTEVKVCIERLKIEITLPYYQPTKGFWIASETGLKSVKAELPEYFI